MAKKQNYDRVLKDPVALDEIRKWVNACRSGLRPTLSACGLVKEIGYQGSELNRELVALIKLDASDSKSFSASVEEALKKPGIRSKLFPQLAALIFNLNPLDQLTRLVSFAGLDAALSKVSAPVESLTVVMNSEEVDRKAQSDAIVLAADQIFNALGKMDGERKLLMLRIVCLIHLAFRWSIEVANEEPDLVGKLSERFYNYLGVPLSDRSLERLNNECASIVSRIQTDQEPLSVLMPNFTTWWESLFIEINRRGSMLLADLAPQLRALPGNPFKKIVEGTTSEVEELEDEGVVQAKKKDQSEDCENEQCLDPVIKAAIALRKTSADVRPRKFARRLRSTERGLGVFVCDVYEGLGRSDIADVLEGLRAVEEKTRLAIEVVEAKERQAGQEGESCHE
ncbi:MULTISPECIES: hypothetical protein [unclassified Lentimonas]|uniref:hypothetical protein n=1 Tax=unclassified Lentimonas TaxID=2630993 RepID=UPI0013231E34|nr:MULTISPECIES: hypothetical protein [unclassified Lentimonas]CAA6679305.1 Unannotated [Lentimonas sp. CC4]CAA6686341.1 Unannotated [Lentimonas sp. CC6]CAA7076116.1 Unannotated [Lentimonas sp. CC4]CAA7170891.1 Unannotated [Lentimonas sp. CC21]CAA7181167.1 Unannotated [Lentimonas sp. CC8]